MSGAIKNQDASRELRDQNSHDADLRIRVRSLRRAHRRCCNGSSDPPLTVCPQLRRRLRKLVSAPPLPVQGQRLVRERLREEVRAALAGRHAAGGELEVGATPATSPTSETGESQERQQRGSSGFREREPRDSGERAGEAVGEGERVKARFALGAFVALSALPATAALAPDAVRAGEPPAPARAPAGGALRRRHPQRRLRSGRTRSRSSPEAPPATSIAPTTAARAGATPASKLPFPGWVVGTLVFDREPAGPALGGALGDLGRRPGRRSRTTSARPGRSSRSARSPASRSTRWRACRARRAASSPARAPACSLSDDVGLTWRARRPRRAGARSTSRACTSIRARPRTGDRRHLAARLPQRRRRRDLARRSSTAWCSTPRSSACTPVPGRPGELWASTCGWVYRGEALGRQLEPAPARASPSGARRASACSRPSGCSPAPSRAATCRPTAAQSFRRTSRRRARGARDRASSRRDRSGSCSAPRARASGPRTTAARASSRGRSGCGTCAFRRSPRRRAGLRRARPRRPEHRGSSARPTAASRSNRRRRSCRRCSTWRVGRQAPPRRDRARPVRARRRRPGARIAELGERRVDALAVTGRRPASPRASGGSSSTARRSHGDRVAAAGIVPALRSEPTAAAPATEREAPRAARRALVTGDPRFAHLEVSDGGVALARPHVRPRRVEQRRRRELVSAAAGRRSSRASTAARDAWHRDRSRTGRALADRRCAGSECVLDRGEPGRRALRPPSSACRAGCVTPFPVGETLSALAVRQTACFLGSAATASGRSGLPE